MKTQTLAGFTLIELLVVIAIIGLLASVVLLSLNDARSKARLARTLANMKNIAAAAELDYHANGNYAPEVNLGDPPRFVPTYLASWPGPPCPNWTYDWDNLAGGTILRVRLKRPNIITLYYYCIYTTGSCGDGNGSNILSATSNVITCNE